MGGKIQTAKLVKLINISYGTFLDISFLFHFDEIFK
jgi:hypothetical protein